MPDSVEPIASVITRPSGRSSASCSFTVCEKIAAVLLNEKSDERSTSSCIFSSASASGRAIASPVTPIMLTRCFSTSRHISSASNLSTITAVLPSQVTRKIENWPAPCMSGGIGRLTSPPAATASIFSLASCGDVTRSLVSASMPPPSAKYTSSWRHITPLGMPVVPPV